MVKDAERPKGHVDRLVQQVADEIVDGRLLPGVRLDEVGLAERFGVSRTPVREALRQLEATGLLQRRPSRGVVVATVTPERLADMFEAMAEMEALCARLAAQRMTARERQSLGRLHERSGRHVERADEARYEEVNRRFHEAFYDGAHNAEIAGMALAMRARLAPFRRAQFRVAGRLEQSHAEHALIVAAVLKRDPSAADAAMREHIRTVSDASEHYRSSRLRPR
jgi:DNA-binding GntR family transcriptional regulator